MRARWWMRSFSSGDCLSRKSRARCRRKSVTVCPCADALLSMSFFSSGVTRIFIHALRRSLFSFMSFPLLDFRGSKGAPSPAPLVVDAERVPSTGRLALDHSREGEHLRLLPFQDALAVE